MPSKDPANRVELPIARTRLGAVRQKQRLSLVLYLTTTYLIVEVVGGLLTSSLALLADAGHMLTDVGGLALSLLAIRFAEKPATPQKTYGFYRAEILAALANAVILLAVSAFILYEASRRFAEPPEVRSLPMLVIAAVGLIVNLAGMRLLSGNSQESLNVKGAYLEVMSDALSSMGVIIAGTVMLATGWYLADPIISVAIGLFILPRTWSLLTQSVHILMEGAPARLDLTTLEAAMKQVEGVRGVHDLHVWTLTSGVEPLSAHVVVDSLDKGRRALGEIQRLLRETFNIGHITIQLEERADETRAGESGLLQVREVTAPE